MRLPTVAVVLVALAVGVVGARLAGRGAPAAADEVPKAAARWEYMTLAEDHKKCVYAGASESVEAKTWVDLAKELKIELKGDNPAPVSVRTRVFNHFGAQGWELAGQSAMANDISLAIHYTFRRRLP